MYKLAVIGTVATTTLANSFVNQENIDKIRQTNALWTPMEVSENPLANMTDMQLKGLLGTALSIDPNAPEHEVTATPTSFDSRTQWPGCVHAIRDQQQCGSCWAFAASEALSDRFCIASNKKVDVVLSPQDMVSCDSSNYACDGGYLNLAWKFLESKGVATDSCDPYVSGDGQTVPSCPTKCKNAKEADKKYKCKKGTVKSASGPAAIKSFIQASGPVETGFTVYSDFFNYKSGIYHHTNDDAQGGHAVKIIGWGVQGKENYWIVANSWGTDWGMKGFFNIRQGDSGIDQQVWGCTPDVTAAMTEEFAFE